MLRSNVACPLLQPALIVPLSRKARRLLIGSPFGEAGAARRIRCAGRGQAKATAPDEVVCSASNLERNDLWAQGGARGGEARQCDRQAETAWTGAAGIEIENAIPLFNRGLV